MKPQNRNFRDAICKEFRCGPDAYPDTVFWRCLYPHAIPVAWVIRRLNPHFFATDFDLIRLAASCTNLQQLRSDARRTSSRQQSLRPLRRLLRIRLSGRRLIRLGGHVLARQTTNSAP